MSARRRRSLIRLACGVALAASSAGPVAANEGDELEVIVVTGSRIARPDFESASPIVSVTAERFEQTSAVTVEGVLNTLPQFVPSFGSTSNNPANGGQGNLSLRGLPTTATLVLFDGRRLMPANGTGVVDVNIVPPALVERVEVITGGASAVYGSDAVAGVVNILPRRNFEGVELDGSWGVSDRGDAEEYSVGIAAGTGFAGDRGSVMGYVGYTERDQVDYADRKFSRYALNYIGPGRGTLGPDDAYVPAGSATIEEGRARLVTSPLAFDTLFASYGYPSGTVPFQRDFGFNDDGTLFTLGLLPRPVPGGVANFRGERDPVLYNDIIYGYNFATLNALQLPLERLSVFGRADVALNEAVELFAEVLYADYTVSTQLAPTPVMGVFIPATNPYIPPDLASLLASRTNPSARFEFSKRMSELGPRQSERNYDVYQVAVGATGRFAADWTYDAYVQAGRNESTDRQSNNVLRSRFEQLTFAPDGGLALCGGFDPFGRGSISPACADYVAADGTNRTNVEQFIAEASLNGPVLELPAGALRGAFGVMHKRDEFSYRADEVASTFLPDGRSDIVGFNPADDIDGEDHNTDLYVEALVPLLSGRPGAQALEAVLGYRWSDYASAGSVDAYKAELLYRPVGAVQVRGSLQHAVRAPSIFELYLPQLGPEVFLIAQDPCNVQSAERTGPDAAAVEQLCLAQGIPAELLPTFAYPEFAVDGVAGGNPDLEPETADTYTVGVVFSARSASRWLENLQVSIDWYQIEVEDAIADVPAEEFVPRCYDPRYNPAFSVSNAYCSYFRRDPATGVIEEAKALARNIAGYRTSGLDLQFDWGVAIGPGDAGLNWLVAYVASFEELRAAGADTDEFVGTIGGVVGGALPEWKWNLRASYAWAEIDAALQWRYVHSMQDARISDYTVPSRDYLDLTVGFEFGPGPLAGLSVRAGVDNLTNAQPPLFPSYVQANTDPSQFDVLGRRYYVGLDYRY